MDRCILVYWFTSNIIYYPHNFRLCGFFIYKKHK
jgi:hypothetical protein